MVIFHDSVIGAIAGTLRNIIIQSRPLPSIGVAFMSLGLFGVSIGRCNIKDTFTRFNGYTGVVSSGVALVLFIIGGAFPWANDGQHSVLLIAVNACGSVEGNTCFQTIDSTEELEGGDLLATVVWIY